MEKREDKTKLLKMTFLRNTFIGFDNEEITRTSSEDLVRIRKSVYAYITSPNLKKRNADFIDCFKRISRELKARGVVSKTKVLRKTKTGEVFDLWKEKGNRSTCPADTLSSHGQKSNAANKDLKFLKKKHSLDFDFPGFLNDKNYSGRVETVERLPKKECTNQLMKLFQINQLMQQYQMAQQNTSSNLQEIILNQNLNSFNTQNIPSLTFISKGCSVNTVPPKLIDKSDWSSTLNVFTNSNADKPYFLPSRNDDDDILFSSYKDDFDLDLKQIELKSAIFNEVTQDLNFELE